GLVRLPTVWQSHREWNTAFHAEQHAIVEWLHDHVPARSRLMVIDAGFLAYATDYPLVDAVGLKTPAIGHANKRLPLPSCGVARGQALSVIAKTSAAEYFVSWGEWESSLRLAEQLSDAGTRAEEVRQRPLSVHMDWWYPVFRLSVP